MSETGANQRGGSPEDRLSDSPTVRDLLPARRVFGRYLLEEIAGRGGMGVVWRARDTELDRPVALKFLSDLMAADPEAIRDLKRETKRCLDLTHPYIVRVYDFAQDGPMAAIVMEFVDGESLAKRKATAPGGCLDAAELSPLVAQLCSALDYAHFRARIVHHDLKPANLLVTREGELKITDFGIAQSLAVTMERLTNTGTRITSGTLFYMSPQQLLGSRPTVADDIYALGVTLYELLTGKPPFYRGDPNGLTKQIAECPPEPLTVHRREAECSGGPIPPAWEATIAACLAKEPTQRPKSAGEVATRLGAKMPVLAAADDSQPTLDFKDKPGKVTPGGSGWKRRRFLIPATFAVSLGLVLLLAWGYPRFFSESGAKNVVGRLLNDNKDAAATDYDAAIALDSKNAVAYYSRGLARQNLGQSDGSIADFDRAIAIKPQYAVAYNARGISKHSKSDYDGAIADFSKALAIDPNAALYYFNRGNTKQDKGDFNGAIADYDKAVGLDASLPGCYNNRGNAKQKMGDFDGAIADYDKAIALNPNIDSTYQNRGNAKTAKGDIDGGIADREKALALNPNNVLALNFRGNYRIEKHDYDGAMADFAKVIALDPKSAKAYLGRGRAKSAKGDHGGAIIDFDKAIALDPKDPAPYNERGRAKSATSDYGGAILDFDKAIAFVPKDAAAYNDRGFARFSKGNFVGAFADYDKAIALDPNFALAYAYRALAKHHVGDEAGAQADDAMTKKLRRTAKKKTSP